jgi:hypothetical protein
MKGSNSEALNPGLPPAQKGNPQLWLKWSIDMRAVRLQSAVILTIMGSHIEELRGEGKEKKR